MLQEDLQEGVIGAPLAIRIVTSPMNMKNQVADSFTDPIRIIYCLVHFRWELKCNCTCFKKEKKRNATIVVIFHFLEMLEKND